MRTLCSFTAALLLLLAASRPLFATGLKQHIPSSPELTGFTITHDPAYYTRETLWDYMNGGAPGYLAYGFEEMATLQVKSLTNHSEMTVDIYDMGSHLNAFGIYSVERIPGARDLPFGAESFHYDTTLCFWQDRYYVKLMAYEMKPETVQSLSAVAALITRKLPKGGETPPLLSVLPQEGRVKNSERYIKSDVLGQAYFNDGYSVEYEKGNRKHTIFLINGKDPREAGNNFQTYRSFIKTIGQITEEAIRLGDEAFAGTHTFYGRVLFARKGSFIVGVVGLHQQNRAHDTVRLIFSRLEQNGRGR